MGRKGERWNCSVIAPPPLTITSNLGEKKKTSGWLIVLSEGKFERAIKAHFTEEGSDWSLNLEILKIKFIFDELFFEDDQEFEFFNPDLLT